MKRGLVFLALLAGLGLRAAALPLPGTGDVGAWKLVTFVASQDPAGVYGVGGSPPERRLLKWGDVVGTTEYPPLAIYQLATVGRAYWQINPLFRDSPALTALVKTPGLVAEVLLVAVMLTWGRRRFGAAAVWTALAFWLNPAVLLNGAVLGYLDAQMAVPATLAIVAAAAGHPGAAGALAACAVLTKPQALFVLPAIAVAVWHKGSGVRGLARAAGWGAGVTALLLLPIALRGALPNMVQAMARLGAHGMISGFALNVWWIATWIVRSAHAEDLGWWAMWTLPVRILQISDWMRFYPNPKPFASVAVVAAIVWACWRSRHSRSAGHVALLGAWCVYVYSMLAIQVHENHLYLAVPFLAFAAGLERSLRPLMWSVSAMAALNMYVFYGLGDGWPPLVNRAWTGVDLSVWLAFVNVGVFIWATRVLFRRQPRRLNTEGTKGTEAAG